MSALGGILAAVEQRVAELLDGLVKRLENLEQTSATGAAVDDQLAALSDRVAALEASGGTGTPKTASATRTRNVSASAGTAGAKGKAADTK